MTTSILIGDALAILKTMPDASVDCCVTSPPYYGLRDYGVAGQIGLEETPDAYVGRLVDVFREVRRVLKDDGVLFLNLGDSYWTSGQRQTGRNDTSRETPGGRGGSFRGGVRRAIACDTDGKALEDSQGHDCFCQSLCDACREAYRIGKSHSGRLHDSKPLVSNSASSPARMGSPSGHLPTSDLIARADRSEAATPCPLPSRHHGAEPLLASPASTTLESFQPRPEGSRQSDSPSVCLVCGETLQGSALASARKADCTCDTEGGGSADRKTGMDASGSAYRYLTTKSLKPKDLIGIPWRVAFALQADGWYLRQDIIWHKPNPMPESVKDRCTKAHEYVFMLSKSSRYFYDADAIAEESIYAGIQGQDASWFKDPQTFQGKHGKADKQRGHSRRHAGFNDRWDAMTKQKQCSGTRNKRSVWSIAIRPFAEAHFATMAPELAELCVKAGCPLGGTVLDPFGGAGTTALAANRLQRNAILIELNPEYAEIARARLANDGGLFAEVAA